MPRNAARTTSWARSWKDGGAQGYGGQPFEWGGPGEAGGDFHFSGTGFSDFFERFFGRHTQPGGFPPGGFPPADGPGRQRRGRDIEADLLVTLEEALRGGERSLGVRRPGGESRRLTVKIPAGVREGQQLRVRGHGRPGAAGGEPGDLYLFVRFEQHPVFRASGDNLVTTLDLAPWEAVLGARVTLAALDGKVRLTVPPGTKEGEELVARSLGLPDGHGGRGDLRAIVRIVVPSQVTPGEQAAWEALKQASSFHPRD